MPAVLVSRSTLNGTNGLVDPPKAAMATELTQKLAQAYREIEAALRDKRPPGKHM